MSTSKGIVLIAVLVSMLAALGCKPAPNRNRNRGIGRGSNGPSATADGKFTNYQSNNAGTSWGIVTSTGGDKAFGDQLYYMTLPMLAEAPADQQLGFVSASANQATNVVFWGEAPMYAAGVGGGVSGIGNGQSNRTIDGSKARMHIEIWDDKAVTNGVSPIILHIGYDFEGFAGASGEVKGNQATVTFNSSLYGGAIALQGTLSGQYYTGTMYFKNSQTAGQFYPVGNFQVPACGFFVCN